MTVDRTTLADLIRPTDPAIADAVAAGNAQVTERDLPFEAAAVQVVVNEPRGERGAWFGVGGSMATLLSGNPDGFVELARSAATRIENADAAVRYAVALLDTTRRFDQPEYRIESVSDVRMSPPLIEDDRRAAEEFRRKYSEEIAPPSARSEGEGSFEVTAYRVRQAKVERVTVEVTADGGATVSAEALEPTPPLPMSL